MARRSATGSGSPAARSTPPRWPDTSTTPAASVSSTSRTAIRSLTSFRIVIDAHPRLTAIVNGDPKVRVSILRLDLSKATVTKPLPYVRVGNVGAYLNATAAGALNRALGVSFFAPGIKLGTAYVKAHVAG